MTKNDFTFIVKNNFRVNVCWCHTVLPKYSWHINHLMITLFMTCVRVVWGQFLLVDCYTDLFCTEHFEFIIWVTGYFKEDCKISSIPNLDITLTLHHNASLILMLHVPVHQSPFWDTAKVGFTHTILALFF